MINILKPSAAWVTALQQDKFSFATLKLTFFYVLSTAVILFVSSLAVLLIFTPPETELIFESESMQTDIEHGEWSVYEIREHLSTVIFLVDIFILVFVSFFAHSFARRTLLPIKQMHKTQQQFMSDVAHELRTPLAVMQVGADTILRQPRSQSEYQDFVIDVQSEAGRLTRLSNQLLQLLKNDEQKQVILHSENISVIVENQVKRFVDYAKVHDVDLVTQVTPNITTMIEKDSLIEVLQNLLKNAVDYNKPKGKVTVSLVAVGDRLKLAVQDTGVGIPLDKQQTIFNRFTKADTARTTNNESGTGLGLAIVKSLVIKLGGDIFLESAENIGTTITIKLPLLHS